MKKSILIFGFSCFALLGKTQDFHLSMYDAGPLFLNPAMTGVFEGDWRLHAQQRTQWRTVNFKPYNTSLLSFDMPTGKWGFGAQIINMRAGLGNYNALQGTVSAAYTVPLDRKKTHNFSMGLQAGVTQKSVEYQLLTYDNQYVTTNGGGFDNSLPSGENFQSNSVLVPQLNAGLLYYHSKQQSRLNPFLGVSAFNLLTPKESFFSGPNKLPMRFYAHTGVRINITEFIYVLPKVLYMMQSSASEITAACDAGFFMKQSEVMVLGGVVYRNKDAAILSLGARKGNFTGKLAYDINISTLQPSSNGKGAFEVSLTYIGKKPKSKTQKICPRI
ncbi:MAG: type IX secretion system membrane protein PorP/SprF [Flavobacteriales bacterium]|nr:type IX secretion system membrane protein PorP/SprF [Flavobacteriales bacterium]